MGKSLRISIIVFLVLLIMFHGLGIILLPIFIYLTNNEKRKAVLLKKISSIETYSDNTKINIPDKEEEIINLESKLTLKKQNRDNFEKEVSIFFLKYPNLSFIGR